MNDWNKTIHRNNFSYLLSEGLAEIDARPG